MGAVGFQEATWIWRDGEYVAWHECKVHLLATAVQFGTSVFEGIRAYETPEGPAVFRLDAHIDRLIDSAKIYRMVPDYSADDGLASTESRLYQSLIVSTGISFYFPNMSPRLTDF